jgi:molybdate transport system ATP-binding protein
MKGTVPKSIGKGTADYAGFCIAGRNSAGQREGGSTGTGGFFMDIKKKLPRISIDFSLSCRPGEVCSLVGPSGAGKTTLLRCIAGFIAPEEGEIRLGERLLYSSRRKTNLPTRVRRVGLMTQEPGLFPHMTVLENVLFARRSARQGAAEVMALLEVSGIAHLAGERPEKISGGERQRAALCRVLAMQPDLLLLDEPFSSLDMENRGRLQKLVWENRKKLRIPVLYVTHDLRSALEHTDRCETINEGRSDPAWLLRQLGFLREEQEEYKKGWHADTKVLSENRGAV